MQNQQRPLGAPSWKRCHRWWFNLQGVEPAAVCEGGSRQQDSSMMASITNMPPIIWTTCTGRGRTTFYYIVLIGTTGEKYGILLSPSSKLDFVVVQV